MRSVAWSTVLYISTFSPKYILKIPTNDVIFYSLSKETNNVNFDKKTYILVIELVLIFNIKVSSNPWRHLFIYSFWIEKKIITKKTIRSYIPSAFDIQQPQ